MNLETHSMSLAIKAVSEEGEFEGHAAVFGNVDLGGDIVLPGAFTKSLRTRPASKVKLLRNHDMSEPIGVVLDLAEDKKGLAFKAKVTTETTRGRETLALMRMGSLDQMSFGYRTVKDRYDSGRKARLLEEVEVFELTVCALGMNPKATISRVKDFDAARAETIIARLHRAREALRA